MALMAAIRFAMSATSCRASTSLSARWPPPGNSRSPWASTSSSALSSRPKVAGPRLPTISGTFLRTSLSRAWRATSWLSAAKPTQYGCSGSAATAARMSGFSVSSKLGSSRPRRLLDLLRRDLRRPPVGHCGRGHEHVVPGRQRTSRRRASAARCARRCESPRAAWPGHRPGHQRHARTGLERGARNGKAHLAARQVGDAAHRVDRLVGRARRSPAPTGRPAPWAGRTRSGRRAVRRASSMRPSPISPHAWSPAAGPSTMAPSAITCATLRCVAGWAHISRFIAGATSNGHVAIGRARQARLSSSSARPCASLAMKSALAGATISASACAREVDVGHVVGLARVPLAGEDRSVRQACIVTAPMNARRPRSSPPAPWRRALTSSRVSSAAL